MARKGISEDAVSFETKTFTLKISRDMTRDIVTFMHQHKIYANRADFILYSIRWFNYETLKFLLKNKSNKKMSDSQMAEKIAARRDLIMGENDSYIDYKEKNRYQDSVTFRITDGLKDYCSILNDDSWKFESVQDYMRAAIAWRIKNIRDNHRAVIGIADQMSKDLFGFICPFNVSRGPEAFDDGEMMIDIVINGDNQENRDDFDLDNYDDRMVDIDLDGGKHSSESENKGNID